MHPSRGGRPRPCPVGHRGGCISILWGILIYITSGYFDCYVCFRLLKYVMLTTYCYGILFQGLVPQLNRLGNLKNKCYAMRF